MPLLDHFRPPIDVIFGWDSLHSSLGTRLADALNERWLTREYLAVEHTHVGPKIEIDVATLDFLGGSAVLGNGGAVLTEPRVWAPPATLATTQAVFPDSFEVRVYANQDGRRLVGAIELVSPSNKDRPDEREAFVAKCASYLQQGVSLVILDVVTTRHTNLHNELVRWLRAPAEAHLPASVHLYAAAYRPVLRGETPEIDIWAEKCVLGAALPTMPLRLTGDLFVPVEFESAYQETCRRRRLI